MPSPPTSSGHNNPGRMDTKSVSCVVNSISRFIHLVSCQTIQTLPTLKSYKNIASMLKLLKPVLDDIVDYKVPSDKVLCKECEELDVAVNEAREFMESWSSKMSKIRSVLKSEPLVMKIQSSSLEICRILCRLLHSSSSTSSFTGVQQCMQELQCLKLERISECIEEAVKVQRAGMVPPSEHLITIVNSLGLTSNQELLKESIVLEKERMMAQVNKVKGEIDQINIIIDLMSHIRDCMVKHERFKAVNGVRIPSYFRCPLSLELMLDPVIVASGQTYDRTSIQKWLDNGLSLCPKSHQILSHTNLIPNFTVKALIANWCEENHIKFPNIPELANTNMPAITQSEDASCQDLIRMDSFHSSHSNDSTSRSSHEVGNGFQKLKTDVPFRFNEQETNGFQSREPEIFDHSSPEQSYVHSRSESASSAISSVDYLPAASTDVSRISSKHENASELSGEMISECPIAPLNKNSEFYPRLSERVCRSSKTMAEIASNGNSNYPRTLSLPSEGDDLTTTSHVEKLVEDLKSQAYSVQTSAAAELRFLAKHNTENRVIIGRSGAIAPLLSLLYSDMKLTQEHAVTALLNLSISEDIKARIAEAGAIEPLIHVLRTGNARSKENAAVALFSLSLLEEYKMKIGRSSAVKALVDLLETGTLRGKKDAATALFNLSIFHENKARIVQAGAVKYLVELLNPETEMVDKAVALLANLSTIAEGCTTIARAGGIPFLVEIIETGSQRGKENAASILFQLCINNPKFCRLVLQEGAVPPLVALSQSGTPRAKEKAQQLLSHFRNQREGPMGKGK